MARAAVLGRLTWLVGTVTAVRDETSTARTIVLDVPGWRGHAAGQHVDVRLTAEDGYSAQRSYSIASAADPPVADRRGGDRGVVPPGRHSSLELTIQRLADGEVSPYLSQVLDVGYPLELRGPIGGWFVWNPDETAPVLLVAGGSGIVPLMAMIRARARAGSRVPFRLIYSVRDPGSVIYADELAKRAAAGDGLTVTQVYTRQAPPGFARPPGRISAADLAHLDGWLPRQSPAVFVCGPTGYVEAVASLLTAAGHRPGAIKTERFGPTG
jgi:ferredoxin-NADP reductase